MNESPLTVRTRELLRCRSRLISVSMIAEATGLTYSWIVDFQREAGAHDYGANKVTLLYEYLAGKKLEIA